MFILIKHQLRFAYDRPVFIEPLTIRLTPRQDVTQRLLHHEMTFDPTPQGKAWNIEPEGTDARTLWFANEQATLTIDCTSVVETLRDNPFEAIITHQPACTLPAAYLPEHASALAPLLADHAPEPVRQWSARLARDAGHDTLAFLSRLTTEIHASFRIIERLEGDPFTAEQTLTERTGACRDVTMLFLAACRCQNLAARFVSGYSLHAPPETTAHELHAWAEVYLPGGGWRGYDPSLGLAVADGHIALASAPDHLLAAPTSGSYRGTGVRSRLDYDILLHHAPTRAEIDALLSHA
jgi:transglutaminase-like putative cysteine protease